MADNRLPNIGGQGGMHPSAGYNPNANMGMGMAPQMFGGMQQQQQQFVPGMQYYPQGMNQVMMGPGQQMFPAQNMRPPGGPPPPYTQQLAASYQHKARGGQGGVRKAPAGGGPPKPKTDKERYFEEQQKRLRHFHKAGSHVTADASSLVDNLFGGKTATHKTATAASHPSNQHSPRNPPDNFDDEDSFGDYLGGPTSSGPAPTAVNDGTEAPPSSEATPTPTPAPCPDPHPPAVVPEKKDLMSMMLECSDLNAPQKARGFHKPSLMEVGSGGHAGVKAAEVHHDSDHARRWDNTQELEGLFIVPGQAPPPPPQDSVPPHSPTSPTSFPPAHLHHPPHPEHTGPLPSGAPHPHSQPHPHPQGVGAPMPRGGVGEGGDGGMTALPDWCQDSGHNLPVVYQQVLEAVVEGDHIVTERLYPILLLSGLPRELLGSLWTMANTRTPGQLTRSELWLLLALVALVQNKFEVTSLAILKRCPQAPVPFLGQSVNLAHNAPGQAVAASADVNVYSNPMPAPNTHGFVPGPAVPANVQPPPLGGPPTLPTTLTAVLPPGNLDDDFDDFQEAPVSSIKAPPSAVLPPPGALPVTRQDDSYGEFIGGKSSDQSLSSVPAEAAEKLEKLYSNGGISTEDHYHSNVRNFFCSSDSSTEARSHVPAAKAKAPRHTTPNSLDEDDFSEGHDSLSAVSTSEQSENEDIRAFETYVEEFNRKKEAAVPDNPLRRPAAGTLPQGSVNTTSGGERNAAGKKTSSVMKTPPAVNVPIPRLTGASPVIPSLPPGRGVSVPSLPHAARGSQGSSLPYTGGAGGGGGGDDDFDDFKSAAGPTGVSEQGGEVKGEVALIGDEDKYGALRSMPTTAPSLFERAVSGGHDEEGEEEEEWADFSTATTTTAQPPAAGDSFPSSGSATQDFPAGQGSLTGAEPDSSSAGGWAADFAAGGESDETGLSGGGGLGGGLSGGGGGLFSSSDQHNPTPTSSSSWSHFPGAPSVPAAQTIGQGDSSTLGGQGDSTLGGPEDSVDDWADFSSAKPSQQTPDFTAGVGGGDGGFSAFGNDNHHHQGGVGVSSQQQGMAGLSATSSDLAESSSSSDVFTGADQSAVLTVKKQNLGTSEIMNVFKVRDDPATLSSYELHKPTPDHPSSGVRHHHHHHHHHPHDQHKRSRRSKEMSPDLDLSEGPPPLDSVGDEEEEEFSRGYDLDDIVNVPVATTGYSPFGFHHQLGGGYAKSAFTAVTKTSRAPGVSVTTPTPAVYERGSHSHSHSMSPESGESDQRVPSQTEDSQSLSSLDLPHSKVSSGQPRRASSDNGGTDSQSVSSMEFGAVEVGGEGGVSGSRSLDSLDLRAEDGEEGEETLNGGRQPSQPTQAVMGSVPLADRYNITGQVEGNGQRYAYQWERCLASSSRHINNANTVFNTISRSSVCNQVLGSPQGSDYISGLIEIYRVVCRIMTTLPTTAVTSSSIEQSLKQIDLAWNNLTAFLVGASLLPEEVTLTFTQAVLKSDSAAAQRRACGVCLLDVECRGLDGEITPALDYAGRQYHAPCANFWLNCVDCSLPALKLPELL